jgi:2,4-diketo-3-deoxy-L-fuconate hydrolase
MILVRVGAPGSERPGLIDDDGTVRDLSAAVDDIAGSALTAAGLGRLRALRPRELPALDADARLGPPVGRIGKMICVGLNYADHAAESGLEAPRLPVIFMKATTAICGPCDDVVIPRGSQKTDWEVELGVVIGDVCRDVPESQAMHHVAGYLVVNDLSERAFQLEHGGQWVKGKSCDTFGPLGPWLVSADAVPEPHGLGMWLEVNGHRYQHGTTANMIFRIPQLVSHISRYMTLMPGDVISTGTPAGVGLGQKPPVYLKPGDVIELSIEGLGRQRQQVVESG